MKKIKLFLVTLLCVVGVMNVCAQEVVMLSVNRANGYLDDGDWYSNQTYDGGRLHVHNNAWLTGLSTEFTSEGFLEFTTSRLRTNTITINAPSGYVLVGYKLTVSCTNGSVNVEGEAPVVNGVIEHEIGNTPNTSFTINATEGMLSTVTWTEFLVYFKKKPTSVDNLLDAYSNPIESGAMYVISNQYKGKEKDVYFSVDGTNVKGVAWPSESGAPGFVNVNAVWEMTILNTDAGKRLAFMSMSTNKYLGDVASESPTVTPESKSKAMQFEYDGPYTQGGSGITFDNRTDNYYTLKFNSKYLSYSKNDNAAFSMNNSIENDRIWEGWGQAYGRSPQRFRFHKIDYVRVGVFSQQNGVLTPLHYNVTVNTGDEPTDNTKQATLAKYGQSELCCEHNENTKHAVLKSIKYRVKNIETVPADIPDGSTVKYIVNGEEVPSINYDEIVHGYNISVIYVLPDTPVDPDDPDPSVAAAKFYKLKSKVDNKYLSVVTSNNTTKLMAADDSNDAIFYHEYADNGEKHLLSYTGGVYVKKNSVGVIEEAGSDLLLAQFPNTTGKWDVRMGAEYLTCDSYDGVTPDMTVKPNGEYDLIPVTELPVKLNPVGDHRYGTFYAPVDVSIPEDLEAYVGVVEARPNEEYDVMKLTRVYEVPANTGVLLYEENATDTQYSLTIEGSVTGGSGANALDGTCARKYASTVGDYENGRYVYGLNQKNGKVGFFKMNSTAKLSAFRAFLDSSVSAGAKNFAFSFDETDLVEAIEMSHNDNTIYDLQGRRVQNPGTGIYIVNGKKIMITK